MNDRFRQFAHAVSLVLLALAFALPAAAQDKPKGNKERIDALEAKLAELDKSLGALVGEENPERLRGRVKDLQGLADKMTQELEEVRGKLDTMASDAEEQSQKIENLTQDIQKLADEIKALQEALAESQKQKLVGYDKGFYLRTDDNAFRLTIGAFAKPYWRGAWQAKYSIDKFGALERDENGAPVGGDTEIVENTFGLDTMRIEISARFFEIVEAKVEIDYGKPVGSVSYPPNADVGDAKYNRVDFKNQTLQFLAAYGEFKPMAELAVRAGQFKLPFDRETAISTREMTFPSKPLTSMAYRRYADYAELAAGAVLYHWDYETQRAQSFGYDRGFQVSGVIADGLFNYAAGLFNGAGITTANDNRDVLLAARVSSDFLGKMTSGASDLNTLADPLASVGFGFAYDRPLHRNFDPQAVTDADKKFYNSEDLNLTGDLAFKWMGVGAMASVFWRTADHGVVFLDSDGKARPIDAMGLTGQLSYYNDYTKLEPAVRYAMFDPDIELKLDHVHELTGGLNYYPFGQNMKLMLEYRATLPASTTRSYLMPRFDWEAGDQRTSWYDFRHEVTLMAQFGF